MSEVTQHKSEKSFLNFFPVPEYLLMSTSGLAITDKHIRFVEFKGLGGKRRVELQHFVKGDLSEGIVERGDILNPTGLSQALGDISDRYHIRYTRAAIPDEKAYLFTAEIDRVEPEDMRDAVAFIIEENAPVSLSESTFAFEVIKEGGNKVRVAVSVVPSKVMEPYIKTYKDAGISVVSFDIESQAIARAIVPKGDTRTHLIINLDSKKTGLYIVEDEVVQFSSTSSYGYGVEHTDSSGIEGLKVELKKLLFFWSERLEEQGVLEGNVEKVIVVGSGAHQEALVAEIMTDIKSEHAMANVWVNTLSLDKDVSEIPFAESLGYATAIGLALPRKKTSYV